LPDPAKESHPHSSGAGVHYRTIRLVWVGFNQFNSGQEKVKELAD